MQSDTSEPPARTSAAARSAICSWSEWRRSERPGRHEAHSAGSLRSVPSPEQGTSHKTRSYSSPALGRVWPRCVTTTAFSPAPSERSRCASTYARSGSASFATTTPPSAPCETISSSCVVFEPGAAQTSSTRCEACTPRSSAGTMLTTSCRITSPQPDARSSHACRAAAAPLACASLRSSSRESGSWYPWHQGRARPCRPLESSKARISCCPSAQHASLAAERLGSPHRRNVIGSGERMDCPKACQSAADESSFWRA
mmetsp:Transcript_48365/g.160282  ORF Transcript_48365/g.160282 Transcript_48365/m.160282 type:complete len:257 (-) Transcript_48365:136-906(-)